MKLTRTRSIALAGTLMLATTALAQDDNGDSRLSRLDANGDNVLNLDEFLASRIAANVDADADGAITLEEFVANLQRNISEQFRGNGQRQRAGGAPRRPRGAGQGAEPNREQMQQRIQQRMSERFRGMDADEDGVVSVTEYRTNTFNNLDQDGDGMLQSSELTARRNRGGALGAGRRNQDQQN